AVRRLAPHVRSTFRPEVLSDIGGFGSVVALPSGYDEPVLVSGNDGAGTKTLVAAEVGRYDTIGIDVVAMCVDDIVTMAAEPLFFLDQVTVGSVDPDRIEQFVIGFAEGCRQAGCALTGGEIAEHPDAMGADDFDLAGFAVGVAERSQLPTAEAVRPGDALIGLASPGIRCNGYSLARKVLMDGHDLDQPAWDGADSSLGDELLRPSMIYAPAVLAMFRELGAHAAAHITGGGLAANLARALGAGVDAELRRGSWRVPPIFDRLAAEGPVPPLEMERVFNMGVGMIVAVAPEHAEEAIELANSRGHDATIVGSISEGSGRAVVVDS
ncbi:MAG: phosphoribosylformylglycinamidine cyclo-ligase, partial [Actinomycetota bacterium]|nr:phosphoribosylformylglycinamidine cyclo-ligase [Actinomycetota bacterium]